MKLKINIVVFALFIIIPSQSFSQFKKKTHILKNSLLQKYVIQNKNLLTSIRFKKATDYNFELFFLVDDTIQKKSKSESYDMGYKGHVFKINNTYGPFPETELTRILDSLTNKKSVYSRFEGTIDTAGITLKTESYFPKDDEDRIYTKVPNEAYYEGGEKKLSAFLSEKLNKDPDLELPLDSVLFFRILINKDSTVGNAETLEKGYGKAGKIIAAFLKESKWVPGMQSGIRVKSYQEVFIRFITNKKVEADYRYQ